MFPSYLFLSVACPKRLEADGVSTVTPLIANLVPARFYARGNSHGGR